MARFALVVVDVQRDFCPGGSLAIRHGDRVIPKLNRVIETFDRAGFPIFFTRDWHPPDHCSFKEQGGTWSPHCVMGTAGAELHPSLKVPPGSTVINKASDRDFDAYSAFQGTGLAAQLKKRRVSEVFLGGLATDYCVKESSLDALAYGFAVTVVKDCVKGVNLRRADSVQALRTMTAQGAHVITSAEAIKRCQRAAMKSSM